MKYRINKIDGTKIEQTYNVHRIVARVLSYFQFNDEKIKDILWDSELPEIDPIDSFFRIKERIEQAKQSQEKVFVFGDYDADGVCATSLMVRFLRRLSVTTGYYIPNRLKEGYGLNTQMVQLAYEKGYRLIICVDNGVSAFEAMDLAKEQGMDVIIIDHHQFQDNNYDYLLHPALFSEYNQALCGAATVLQLIRYFGMDDDIDWMIAMVATIGDMMPVFYLNRYIIKRGLQALKKKGYLPISALTTKKDMDETVISFDVVPAINSIGRLADRANANNLVEYMLSDDSNTIFQVSKQIIALNKERQQLVNRCVILQPEEMYNTNNYYICMSEQYHEGIVGLLSNRLLNQYHKPSLVITKTEKEYKGSGRSSEGFNIYQSLLKYEKYFKTFGGHTQACGFSVSYENYPLLIEALKKEEKVELQEELIDVIEVEIEDLTLENVEEINRLKPFGQSFQCPYFYIRKMPYENISNLKNDWKKTSFSNTDTVIDVLCFQKEYLTHLKEDHWSDIIVSISINEFRNKKSISMIIQDVLS